MNTSKLKAIMRCKKNRFVLVALFAFFMLFLLSALAIAASDLPPGLLKIQEGNQKFATDFIQKVSFLIAFLAGVTTILSPCILPVLPAFFAYTFKNKNQLTKMTLLFFFGFTPVFILLGIATTAAGNFFAAFFKNIAFYIQVAGILLIFLGILYLFGVSFACGQTRSTSGKTKTAWDVFAAGALFGFGWVLCVGPILSGVLLTASVFHNYATAIFMMIAYSLGVFVPLFLLSFFYDKYSLGNSKIMQGKTFFFSLFGGKIEFHSTNLIAGSLLIIAGIIFIFGKGTGFLNASDPWGTKEYFYSLQDWFLTQPMTTNIIGGILLLLVTLGIWHNFRNK